MFWQPRRRRHRRGSTSSTCLPSAGATPRVLCLTIRGQVELGHEGRGAESGEGAQEGVRGSGAIWGNSGSRNNRDTLRDYLLVELRDDEREREAQLGFYEGVVAGVRGAVGRAESGKQVRQSGVCVSSKLTV